MNGHNLIEEIDILLALIQDYQATIQFSQSSMNQGGLFLLTELTMIHLRTLRTDILRHSNATPFKDVLLRQMGLVRLCLN